MDHVLYAIQASLLWNRNVFHVKSNSVQFVHHLSANVLLVIKVTSTTVLKRNVYLAQQAVSHVKLLTFQSVWNVLMVSMLVWLMVKIHAPNVSIIVEFVTMVLLVLNAPKALLCRTIRLSAQLNAHLNAPLAAAQIQLNASVVTQEQL